MAFWQRAQEITWEELIDFYKDLVSEYPLQSIEDPLEEEDFDGFAQLVKTLNIQIVGDDLFVTNVNRLRKGIAMWGCERSSAKG